MRVVKIERAGSTAQGVIEGGSVRIVSDWITGPAETSGFTLPGWSTAELVADDAAERVTLDEVTLAVPIDPARRIICVGMNYRDHTSEIKVEVAAFPVLFTRSLDSLSPHASPIRHPGISETFDFEGEIAVVIGREGRHIAAEQALDHVFGYSCFMDGSVREYQKHSLIAGKNFSHSGAMGPWIMTADEVGDADLTLETRLNGEVVQSGRASDMIFGIREIIAYCSKFMKLQPGDVIATGTPGGVGSRRSPPLWMKPGDRVEVTVGIVGTLANEVAPAG